jgi:hypothetical protein
MYLDARFQIFTAMKIPDVVFWVITPCRDDDTNLCHSPEGNDLKSVCLRVWIGFMWLRIGTNIRLLLAA